MPQILSKKLKGVCTAWRDFQTHVPVKLCTIGNGRHYRAMSDFLDELVDEIGDRESHPMIGLLDVVSLFVHDYEEREVEIPDSERSKRSSRACPSAKSESVFVYRGIEIPRVSGTRSPTSLALREALLSKYKK